MRNSSLPKYSKTKNYICQLHFTDGFRDSAGDSSIFSCSVLRLLSHRMKLLRKILIIIRPKPFQLNHVHVNELRTKIRVIVLHMWYFGPIQVKLF